MTFHVRNVRFWWQMGINFLLRSGICWWYQQTLEVGWFFSSRKPLEIFRWSLCGIKKIQTCTFLIIGLSKILYPERFVNYFESIGEHSHHEPRIQIHGHPPKISRKNARKVSLLHQGTPIWDCKRIFQECPVLSGENLVGAKEVLVKTVLF